MDLGLAVVAGIVAAGVLLVSHRATLALRRELDRIAQAQDALRHDLARAREASLVEIARSAQDIRGDVGEARRALAEVRAVQHARAGQMTQAADSLRRLEAVLAGSASRGAAGENLLARSFAQLPPDLIERDVAFGSRVVEYALRLPGARLLPVDSKWSSVGALERLETCDDPLDRKRAAEQVARELRTRMRELAKYLDPERTAGIAVMAVPDAVHAAAPECLGEGWRDGIVVVPYSAALAYVLTAYRLALRYEALPQAEEIAAHAQVASECVRRAADEVEGRLSRSLVQMQNGRDALREQLAGAARALQRLQPAEADAERLEVVPPA
jgi:DNA recombination protein RmuC